MGLIQNAIKKLTSRNEEKQHMENINKWSEQIEAKKMSANERDLLRYKEEERQLRIKKEVEKYRRRDMDDMWSGQKFNPVKAPNMFKDNVNIFKNGKSPLLNNDHNLIKSQNMFFGK